MISRGGAVEKVCVAMMLEDITWENERRGPPGDMVCEGGAELIGPVLEAMMESVKEFA